MPVPDNYLNNGGFIDMPLRLNKTKVFPTGHEYKAESNKEYIQRIENLTAIVMVMKPEKIGDFYIPANIDMSIDTAILIAKKIVDKIEEKKEEGYFNKN